MGMKVDWSDFELLIYWDFQAHHLKGFLREYDTENGNYPVSDCYVVGNALLM